MLSGSHNPDRKHFRENYVSQIILSTDRAPERGWRGRERIGGVQDVLGQDVSPPTGCNRQALVGSPADSDSYNLNLKCWPGSLSITTSKNYHLSLRCRVCLLVDWTLVQYQ